MSISITICTLLVIAVGVFAFLRQQSFGKLPSGERLERIRKSPNYRNGQFRNLQPTAMMTGEKSRWQALWEFVTSDRSKALSSLQAADWQRIR